MDPETLASLSVEVTIKDGEVIYDAQVSSDEGQLRHWPFLNSPGQAHRFLHVLYAAMSFE